MLTMTRISPREEGIKTSSEHIVGKLVDNICKAVSQSLLFTNPPVNFFFLNVYYGLFDRYLPISSCFGLGVIIFSLQIKQQSSERFAQAFSAEWWPTSVYSKVTGLSEINTSFQKLVIFN